MEMSQKDSQKESMKPSKKSSSDVQGPEFTDRSVYYVSSQPTADIVDIVLKLMDEDEGPTPMKNMRPAKKNPNGADQFNDHHEEYEARGKMSRDKVDRVLTHNSACPKMYDELKKRRSTAKPTTGISHRNLSSANFDPNCDVCVKLKKQAKLESRTKRKRPQSLKTSQRRPRDSKSKVAKPKKQPRRTRPPSKYKLAKIRLNKCCQCTAYCLPSQNKSVSTLKEFVALSQEMAANSANFNCNLNNTSHEPRRPQTPPKVSNSKANVDPVTRETSAPSISSFNSYMSMDHEPMVE